MLKRLAQVKKKKKIDEKAEKDKLDENDLKHPILKKARRRGTLSKEDEKKLPFDIKLKCGKAAKVSFSINELHQKLSLYLGRWRRWCDGFP